MKNVLVMLSTYNGEKYLREQIESVLKQENVKISILVRDDGSTDNTCNILEEYQKKGLLRWYTGKNLKPAKSFIDLIFHATNDIMLFVIRTTFGILKRYIQLLNKWRIIMIQ